jgi:hypothetical protein
VTVTEGDIAGPEGVAGPKGDVFGSAKVQPARQASAANSATIPRCCR